MDVTPNPAYLPGLPKYVSFVDESGHSKDFSQKFLCLAGLIARKESWEALNEKWSTELRREGLTRPFHMRDFAARRGEFDGWDETRRRRLLGNLLSIIESSQGVPIGSVISLEAFRRLRDDAQEGFRDPHFMAFQNLTFHLAVAAFLANEPGPVTMIYAHHPEYSEGLGSTKQLWEAVKAHNGMVRMQMESYSCGEQADYPGLQAADLWAYELRHHFDSIRPSEKKPRWAFQQFVRLGLNYTYTHDFISYFGEYGFTGLGQMSRVQRLGEINLYKPGYTGMHPAKALEFDITLRKMAAVLAGRRKG